VGEGGVGGRGGQQRGVGRLAHQGSGRVWRDREEGGRWERCTQNYGEHGMMRRGAGICTEVFRYLL
jgi:hypothetical protein